MSTQHGVDWPRLLGDVQYLIGELQSGSEVVRTPVGTPKLADYLDVSRGTVRNWLDGTEPRHTEGERLIAVWIGLTGKGRQFVPVTVRVFSAAKVMLA